MTEFGLTLRRMARAGVPLWYRVMGVGTALVLAGLRAARRTDGLLAGGAGVPGPLGCLGERWRWVSRAWALNAPIP